MKAILTRLKTALAAFGGLAAAACATGPAADAGPRPALWKLADRDTTIYLFGTIHMLPADLDWRTPAINKAMAEADTVVFETKIGADPMAASKTMMDMGTSPNLPPLLERVRPERREALKKLVEKSGYPPVALDRMETWAAALVLASGALRQQGIKAEAGVERTINASVASGGGGKTVEGIETPEQQFGFFDKLSEESQRAFLEGVIEDPNGSKDEFQAMLNAWRRGDVKAIARSFHKKQALTPEMRDVLLRQRNQVWADWLAKRMEKPGTLFVAVGAGHLAGEGSLHDMLRARGLRTVRVQ